MMNVSLQCRYRAARITADLMRLVALDKVWTLYLNDVKSIPSQDIASLQDLTNEIRQLLVLVPTYAAWLQQQLKETGADFEAELERLFNDTSFPEQHNKELIRANLSGTKGIV